MNKTELERLEIIENRIREIAVGEGLAVKDIIFEIVPVERIMEVSAYGLPENFSHWTFGRDFERTKTIYSHTGSGVTYEIVFNINPIRAFLIETNPFALNVLIMAHCFGHMDMFLSNEHCKQQNKLYDMAIESKFAAKRFEQYANLYGEQEVESVLDAALSIQMHQNPDLFFDEPANEDEARQLLLKRRRAQLMPDNDVIFGFQAPVSVEDIQTIDAYMSELSKKTPPIPTYNILHYLATQKHMPIDDWKRDIFSFLSMQYRYFRSSMNTKLLHEGWATYWHRKIFLQLFEEELVTPEEYGIFSHFDSAVTRENKTGFNFYRIGSALFNYIEERWDKGQFGREYDDCNDPYKRATWNTNTDQGKEKIFEVRQIYNNRMAIEDFFTEDFIREQKIYLHAEVDNTADGDIKDIIYETNPREIRNELKRIFTLYDIPLISVENGNYRHGGLYLLHHWTGFELDPDYRDGVLIKLYYLWRRPIYLETLVEGNRVLFCCTNNNKEKIKAELIK